MQFPEQEYTYENWISQFKSIDKVTDQLRFIITILNSLEQEIQKEFHEQLVNYEKIFEDQALMRKIRHRDALISDYATEYFGDDKGINDPFRFKPRTEETITQLSLNIMATLGLIIKKLKSKTFSISGET